MGKNYVPLYNMHPPPLIKFCLKKVHAMHETLWYWNKKKGSESQNNFHYKWQAYVQKQDGNKKSRINFDMETDEDESGEIFFCQDDHKYMKICYLNLC